MDYEETWGKIEAHGAPCKVNLSSDYKKTYTGPGKEYVALWGLENERIPISIAEIKRDRENVLWGRLTNGDGWIDLKDAILCE
ncbi:MAG: hypothetical protein SO401_01400 [Blautia sp.]|nr:hypothetical protein [Blautia sp.]